MSEDAQRHAVLGFIQERLVTYGNVEGEEPYGTAVGHATLFLPDPTYGKTQTNHRGKIVAFRILKGMENEDTIGDATANLPQVEVESVSEQR